MRARLSWSRVALFVLGWVCLEVDALTRTSSGSEVEVATSAEAAIASLISGRSPHHGHKHHHKHRRKLHQAEHAVAKTVNISAAVAGLGKQLDSLPPSISAFVRTGRSNRDYNEASVDKARKILNNMISEAWGRLDKKIIDCQEFHDQNRERKNQMDADLAQMGDEISDLKGDRGGAVSGVQQIEAQIVEIKQKYTEEVQRRKDMKMSDDFEKRLRQDDIAVATFILKLTKCTTASSSNAPTFLQKLSRRASGTMNKVGDPVPGLRLCQAEGSSGFELRFDNPDLQKELETKMTPRARQMLQQALSGGSVAPLSPPPAMSLLQRRSEHEEDTTDDSTDDDNDDQDGQETQDQDDHVSQDDSQSSSQTMMVTEAPVPVDVAPSSKKHRKCPLGKVPDCALLHDSTSLLFGDMKDAYDEIVMKIAQDDKESQNTLDDFNRQIEILRDQKGSLNAQMAEATSKMNNVEALLQQTEQELLDVEHQFTRETKRCKAEIHAILFTEVCGMRTVRGAVVSHSTTLKPEDIADCEVTDWMPGECSMKCDDGCHHEGTDGQPCGGISELSRDVIQKPNEYGVQCPSLTYKSFCNQVKCPVDCQLSMWSGFSACSKECEGGVRQRDRSVLQVAKRGGESCDTVSESDSCNTGSCDRDCTLEDWSAWQPCSAACGGGLHQRHRSVLVPMRGSGSCPVDWSAERQEQQACNDHQCVGDEVCIAHQDLIIAIDGSGSISEAGFNTIRDFASALVTRYNQSAFGAPAMKVGVVEFGNGEVQDDGTVSPAQVVHSPSADMSAVKTAVDGMSWMKGFTNMAQAFAAAESLWQNDGRKGAQSVVLVITDGKPSFKFQTEQTVRQLWDRNAEIFMVPVSRFEKGDAVEFMKKIASKPVESHFLHIPGLEELKTNMHEYTTRLLTQSCPRTNSAKLTAMMDQRNGFVKLREGKQCGTAARAILGRNILNANGCAALAQDQGLSFFGLGAEERAGFCYAESAAVSSDCPAGFVDSLSDFYQTITSR